MSEEKTVDIESMSSKEALGYFLPKVDEDARKAKKEGRLVCWSASVAPPEFCTAMDIAIVYPETHAAGIGARHGAPAMLEVAENKGYNQDICSYCRVNMGYMELIKQEALTANAGSLEEFSGFSHSASGRRPHLQQYLQYPPQMV